MYSLFSSDKDYWETPKVLYETLDNEFHFTLDPCASDNNHKCSKYYTKETNGLCKSWKGEVVFCNPPYGKKSTGEWVKKCHEEYLKGAVIVMLIPARTDTKWFHDYIYNKHEIRFIKGRLKFEINGIPQGSATFPSMIVVMR